MPLPKHDSLGKPPAGPGKGKGKGSGKGFVSKQPAKKPLRRNTTVVPEHMRRICNSSNIYTILFVFIVSAIFLGGGIALIVEGQLQTIPDLYIVGGISIFIAAVSIAVGIIYCCQPVVGSTRVKTLDDGSEWSRPYSANQYTWSAQKLEVDVTDAIMNRRPSREDLYGNGPSPLHGSRRVVFTETYSRGQTLSPEEAKLPQMAPACAPPPEVALPGGSEYANDPPTTTIPIVRYDPPEESEGPSSSAAFY